MKNHSKLAARTSGVLLLALLASVMALVAAPASAAAPTGPVELISVNADGNAAGDDQSNGVPSISDDGRYVAFQSRATDLIDGLTDANGANLGDVYLRDRMLGTTTLISYAAGSPTTTASGGSSGNPVISDDGRYVVYDSFATNIVTGQTDQNNERDVFVYSVSSGMNTLVSHASTDDSTTCDNGQSLGQDISDDGAYIAFQSLCDDLVTNQNAGGAFSNVFLYDRAANTTIDVVSRPNAVNPANITVGDGASTNPDISGDGSRVVYTTQATNIGAGDGGNGVSDIGYYRQPVGNQPTLSVTLTFGFDGNSGNASVSDNGEYVAFDTEATNVDGTDTNGNVDVALATIPVGQAPTFVYASTNTAGNDTGDSFSDKPQISGDGSYVAFLTLADDIVDAAPFRSGTNWDVVRYGRSSGDVELVSINTLGNAGGNGDSGFPNSGFVGLDISDDGNTVIFSSEASNLGLTDNNAEDDVAVTDFPSGDVTVLSSNANASTTGNDEADAPVISSDGMNAAFRSDASDHTLINDNNNDPDIFAVGELEEEDLELSIAPSSVIEGDDGTVDLTFTVSLSGPAPGPGPVTADYATTDGSATGGPSSGPGIDYRTSSGTVSIAAGSSSGTITVPVYGDTDIEPDETFTVTLSNPSSGVVLAGSGGGFATGTIIDDDDDVMVQGENVTYDGVNDTLRVNINPIETGMVDTASATDISINYSRNLYPTPDPGSQGSAGQGPAREALLATDAVFADALASGALQGNTVTGGRPLLLTDTNQLSPSVVAELERLDVELVHILGGVVAISQTVEDDLNQRGFATNRFEGPSRLETAIDIASGAYPTATTAILARAFAGPDGDDTQAFADSIAAGSWAAERGWPLLLTQTEVLSTSTREYLDSATITTINIVGGTAAVSTEVEQELRDRGLTVNRIEGPSRFDTALAIAAARGYTSESDAAQVMLLEGQAPDAWVAGFTGAGYSASNGAPIVLGVESVIPGQTVAFLQPTGPMPRVDEDNVDGYVLVCGIATSRCDEGRGLLGLPSLAEASEPMGSYAKGATATFELTGTYDSSSYRTVITCGEGPSVETGTGGPTSHMDGQPANSIGVTIPADTPSGECIVAVVLTYSNGSAQTIAARITVTD
ncbi:cell wall-binding repeat-containing protein [Euzebya tangerina]|uniref:cell wall-binding repeat-containing protein n=1 Tax=Euzebya tangerina TaxID=591198 RepID=UPI0013C3497D|nr:cell wall-binding repeat-containing protein [Euzebya tangerina]